MVGWVSMVICSNVDYVYFTSILIILMLIVHMILKVILCWLYLCICGLCLLWLPLYCCKSILSVSYHICSRHGSRVGSYTCSPAKYWSHQRFSLKLTVCPLKMDSWKIGRWLCLWETQFSGAMLASAPPTPPKKQGEVGSTLTCLRVNPKNHFLSKLCKPEIGSLKAYLDVPGS